MEYDSHSTYIETQVMTATPQRLRLMLIEGAIRYTRETLKHWQEKKFAEGSETLMRARQIVTELLAAIKAEDSEVARQVVGIYMFLFRELTEAQLQQDKEKLAGVISILEVEQQTWQQVCEQLPEAPEPEEAQMVTEITASNSEAIPPAAIPQNFSFDSNAMGGGFDSSSISDSSASSGGISFDA